MPKPPAIRRVKESKAGALIAAGERPLIVDVSTEWCPPCSMLAPYLRKLAAEYAGRLDIVEVDGDEADAFKEAWEVEAFPTLLLFDRGRLVDTIQGFPGYEALRTAVRALLDEDPATISPAEAAFAAAAERAAERMDRSGPPADTPENRAIEQAFDALDAFAEAQSALLDAGTITGEEYNARLRAEEHRVLAPHKPHLDAAMARAKEKLATHAAEIDAATAAFLGSAP